MDVDEVVALSLVLGVRHLGDGQEEVGDGSMDCLMPSFGIVQHSSGMISGFDVNGLLLKHDAGSPSIAVEHLHLMGITFRS